MTIIIIHGEPAMIYQLYQIYHMQMSSGKTPYVVPGYTINVNLHKNQSITVI